MPVEAVTPLVPKPGGVQIHEGWRKSAKGRNAFYVAAHGLFVVLAGSYVWAATALVS